MAKWIYQKDQNYLISLNIAWVLPPVPVQAKYLQMIIFVDSLYENMINIYGDNIFINDKETVW